MTQVYQNPTTNPEVLDTSYGHAFSARGFGRLKNGGFWTQAQVAAEGVSRSELVRQFCPQGCS